MIKINKVISFNNKEVPSVLRLKLIAYNVVEYGIKEANRMICPDINPDYICVSDTGQFYCNYKYVDDIHDILQTIEIDTTFNDMSKYDNYITNVRAFAKTYNIHDSNLAIYVFVILHECGHMAINAYLNQRLKGRLDYYIAMQENINSAIFLTLNPYIEDGSFDCAFDYNFNPVEAQANIFAYSNFKNVWDMLISRGLI